MAEQRCSQPELLGRAQQQPAGCDQHSAARRQRHAGRNELMRAAKPTFQRRGHGLEPPATPIRTSRGLIGGSGSSRRCGCSMTIPCTLAVALPFLVQA